MTQNTNKFKQTNAFAMQYGLALGVWGIACLCVMVVSLKVSSLSLISTLMTMGSPVVAGLLTARFRKAVMVPQEGFTFGRGFLFTFMEGIYAAIWIALFVYIYLAYFDHGYIFDTYEAILNRPEYAAELRNTGVMTTFDSAGGITAVIDAMRNTPPAQYAGMVLYTTVLFAPIISALIALICRRAPKFG